MKKLLYFLLVIALLVVLVSGQAPHKVFATGIGEGSWFFPGASDSLKYSTINVEEDAVKAPTWVRLFSEGIKIDSPTKICYPFRYGQFHWVAKIMQVHDGRWVSIKTTTEYLFGNEAPLYACSEPITAGTFALFGYYNGPAEVQISVSSCTGALSVNNWTVDSEPYFTGLSLQNLKAVGINWTSCTQAVGLGWGYRTCIDGDCHQFDNATIGISPLTYPYPQELTETIIGNSSMGIFPQGSQICEFKPYVRLFDGSGNTLDIIYDLDYPDMCLS